VTKIKLRPRLELPLELLLEGVVERSRRIGIKIKKIRRKNKESKILRKN
jgi:hypothetical protein